MILTNIHTVHTRYLHTALQVNTMVYMKENGTTYKLYGTLLYGKQVTQFLQFLQDFCMPGMRFGCVWSPNTRLVEAASRMELVQVNAITQRVIADVITDFG